MSEPAVRTIPVAPAASRPPARTRLYGLGGVFGKTLRDSRWGILGTVAFVGLTLLGGGAAMANAYDTPAARAEVARYAAEMPAAMRGMYGDPIAVGTVGGFLSWHYSGLFALATGLWSILALSFTLAAEVRRGSLELVLTSPIARRRVVVEKVAAHLAAMAVAMALVALVAWLTGIVWARFAEDAIAPWAAVAFALKMGLMALMAGSVAFAIAPLVGHRAAAGLGGALMLGTYVISGWASAVLPFRSVAGLTWFSWNRGHLPLAGVYDWPSQLAMVAAIGILLAIGMEGFVRRDVVAARGLPMPAMPSPLLGLRSALARAFGEQLPMALAWGLGLAAYGFVVAAASRSFAETIRGAGEMVEFFGSFFPGIDLTSPGGFLQLAFAEFGFILIGLAAATFVAGWASDETGGRLEMLLSTPLSRARSAIAGGLAACLAVALAAGILAVAIAAGVAIAGGEVMVPAGGSIVLAVYGAAMAGVGLAVGGVWRPSLAAPAVALVVIATFFADVLVPAFKLPDWVHDLALSAHLGKPMIGIWDWPGMAACLLLAAGGLALGAWGIHRRDINA
jgi:ABC-2 type transport system permease protein